MKSYTDLEQSKKLAEILPLESADMCYRIVAYNLNDTHEYQPYCFSVTLKSDIPCWSLAALLALLPSSTLDSSDDKYFRIYCCNKFSEWHNNPVDACVEIIIKLKEKGLL